MHGMIGGRLMSIVRKNNQLMNMIENKSLAFHCFEFLKTVWILELLILVKKSHEYVNKRKNFLLNCSLLFTLMHKLNSVRKERIIMNCFDGTKIHLQPSTGARLSRNMLFYHYF